MATLNRLTVGPAQAVAPEAPIRLDRVRRPEYGNVLEDFLPGRVFVHPRGITLDRGTMLAYATTFHEANPLYLNEEFARTQGYAKLPAAPHLVLNTALSLGVQNDSEKAIANLGYYDVRFLRAVVAGDTLTGRTRVVARRDRGVGKPGIVTVETLALNQRDEVVVQYRRKIFVPRGGDGAIDADAAESSSERFPYVDAPTLAIPAPEAPGAWRGLTNTGTLGGAFEPGQILVHPNGRTVTDEHVQWTYRVMNTHPLHFDRLYSTGRSGPMSGEPIVYGGLVFAWLLGIQSRDVADNALWDLLWHDGYHTQPTFAGDTLGALTRVLSVRPCAVGDVDAVAVRLQLIGVKNLRAGEALDRYGAELFEREGDKKRAGKSKILEKVFEMERELLVRTGR